MNSLTAPRPISFTSSLVCNSMHNIFKILTFSEGIENITLSKIKKLTTFSLQASTAASENCISTRSFLHYIQSTLTKESRKSLDSCLSKFSSNPKKPQASEILQAFGNVGIDFINDTLGVIRGFFAIPSKSDVQYTKEAILRGLTRPRLAYTPCDLTKSTYLEDFQTFLTSIKNPDNLEIVLSRFDSKLKVLPNLAKLKGLTTIKLKNLPGLIMVALTGLSISTLFMYKTGVRKVIFGDAKKTLSDITFKENTHLKTLPDLKQFPRLAKLNLLHCLAVQKDCRLYAINTSRKNETGELLGKIYS